jgi:3-phenylpropionate/trans-cinnamate dioxygenase ferredoxin reductase component
MRVEQVVIAGAGLAGFRTAEELRSRGYQGGITMIGAERRPPYDRPPLTKKFMTGQLDDTTLAGGMASLGVALRLGERATEVGDGVLRTDHGEYPFGALVIATGAAPVTLPGPGPQRVLRTLDDARALRSALREGTRLAIVGAGWIGAELATSARARGCRVTVVEAAPTPLHAVLGAEVGGQTTGWYAAAGVDLRLGEPVGSVEAGGLALASGEWLPAGEIVTAVGVRPEVGWLSGSRVALDNGVAVDGGLRSSVPGVYAVGDCAAWVSRRYGRRLRVEHWDSALHAPEVAAANVLGEEREYDPVPYFWSEQFGRMVQYAGHHTPADRLVWRGDPADTAWSVCWLAAPASPDGELSGAGVPGGSGQAAGGQAAGGQAAGGPGAGGRAGDRLVAVLTVGRPRDLLQGRRVIASGQPVDATALADPSVPLRDVAQPVS